MQIKILNPLAIFSLGLVLLLSACKQVQQPSTLPITVVTDVVPVETTKPTATSEAIPSQIRASNPTDPSTPTAISFPLLIKEPSSLLPAGMMVWEACSTIEPCEISDGEEDSRGHVLKLIDTLGDSHVYRHFLEEITHIHAGGIIGEATESLPLLFFDKENKKLLMLIDNQQYTLTSIPTPIKGFAGALGKPIIVFNDSIQIGSGAKSKSPRTHTLLIAYNPNRAKAPYVVLEEDTQDMFENSPVLVQAKGDQITDIYYYHNPAIGGGPYFSPKLGLFHLDAASGDVGEILPPEKRFMAISANAEWVAYSTGHVADIEFENLLDGRYVVFPLIEEIWSEGAGSVQISPDGKHIAWIEAYQDEDFPLQRKIDVRLRIAKTTGDVIATIEQAELGAVFNILEDQSVHPVGWLNNTDLVLQLGGKWFMSPLEVVMLNIESMTTKVVSNGEFVGFYYR